MPHEPMLGLKKAIQRIIHLPLKLVRPTQAHPQDTRGKSTRLRKAHLDGASKDASQPLLHLNQ